MKIIHIPHIHFPIPGDFNSVLPFFKRFKKGRSIRFKIRFPDEDLYDIGEDQHDWNKLTGANFNLIRSSLLSSVMVGWRFYNGMIQLCIYQHSEQNRSSENPTGRYWSSEITIERGSWFWGDLEFSEEGSVKLTLSKQNGPQDFMVLFPVLRSFWKKEGNWYRVVFPWFGGNKTTNKTFCYELEIL